MTFSNIQYFYFNIEILRKNIQIPLIYIYSKRTFRLTRRFIRIRVVVGGGEWFLFYTNLYLFIFYFFLLEFPFPSVCIVPNGVNTSRAAHTYTSLIIDDFYFVYTRVSMPTMIIFNSPVLYMLSQYLAYSGGHTAINTPHNNAAYLYKILGPRSGRIILFFSYIYCYNSNLLRAQQQQKSALYYTSIDLYTCILVNTRTIL